MSVREEHVTARLLDQAGLLAVQRRADGGRV